MTTTTNNDLRQNLDEPLKKRPRLNQDNQNIDVCIDLKKLIYYNEISSKITCESNDLTNSTELDGGDSGFQDFTSNDSPLNSSSQKSSCNSNESSNELPSDKFSSIEKYDENENINNLKKNLALDNSKKFDENCKASKNFNLDFTENLINQLEDNSKNVDLVNSNDLNENDKDLVDLSDLNDDDKNLVDLNDDDNNSIMSDMSCLSYLSDFKKWQSNFKPLSWVQQQISFGTNPRQIIDDISPNNLIPNQVDNFTLWRIIIDILSEPPKRKKLTQFNNLEDVVSLIKKSRKIIVLTGAGISVSSGIPDFRSKDGIYARLKSDFPDLPDPQAMFDINYFRKDQRPFFKFAKEIYPGQFKPSLSHNFIKLIEKHGKLLRNYTQNIDTLEKAINIERIITCHGSFATASCTNCKYKVDGSLIKDDIFAQRIPLCPKCPKDNSKLSIMKPDIVFFGEGLPDEFHDSMTIDKNECDLLIVIGSSLKVRPVALIPNSLPADVPQILINREHLSHMTFDVELLGDCDVIIEELCQRLGEGWNEITKNNKLKELKDFNFEEFFNKLSNENKINELNSLSEDQENPGTSKTDFEDRICFNNVLPDDSYVFLPPNRYIFKGAEFYFDSDSYSSSDSEDDDKDENDDHKQNDNDFSDNSANLSFQENSSLPDSSCEQNSLDSVTQPNNNTVTQYIINSNDSSSSSDSKSQS